MNFFKVKLINLKSFKWRLFLSLCLISLIPTIYQTMRTFIVSTTLNSEGIDILGQMEWFDLINETILSFLVIPLYSLFNKAKFNQENFAKLVFKISTLIIFIYLIFQIAVFFSTYHLVLAMNPQEIDSEVVTSYLRTETIAFIIGVIFSIGNVIFIVLGKDIYIYILLIVKTISLIISDFIMVPRFGVMGVAYSNILINTALAIAIILILILSKTIKANLPKKDDLSYLKEWAKVGLYSGAMSLLDNLIYALMIVKMVNMVLEQGNYWVANNFIWGYLIPVLALAEVIKHDAIKYDNLILSNYYLLIIFTLLLWLISIPLWDIFYRYIERLENHHEIYLITLKLLPFYFAYAISVVPDSIFIGLGKTQYNAFNSLIINIVYYGLFYLFYALNIINFNLTTIILMFGFGNVTHLVVSYAEFYFFTYRLRLKKR